MLQPGESGDIPFSIKSKKLRSKFKKSVTVTTDDPVNGQVRLVLRGTVKQYVEVQPYDVRFGRLTGKEARSKVLTITSNVEKPLEINLGAKPANKSFTYEIKEVEPGKKFSLTVTAQPPFEPGRVKDMLKINTNVDQQKTVDVRISAMVPERLDVSPAHVTVPAQRPGQGEKPVRRQVHFTNNGDNNVKLLEATSDDPENIKLTIDMKQDGRDYTILVEMPAGYAPPKTGRTITLKTDDPTKPTIKVPVRGPRARTRPDRKRPAEMLVGKPAPDFTLNTTDGKKVSKETSAGKIVVLDFFAGNCPHCKRQIPTVDKLRKTYEGKGVEFVYVSQTMRGKFLEDAKIIKLMEDMKVTGPLATDPGNTVGPLFKATSFPTMVILGKTGNIEAVNIGNKRDLETRLKGQLDALIAGRPLPKLETKQPPQKRRRRPAMELIGNSAPTFNIDTVDGQPISSTKWGDYKATVLNFVAPNCGFCKRQVPNVEKVRKDYADKGILFVNVAQKMRKDFTTDEVVRVFSGLGSNIPIAHDPTNIVGRKFKAVSFPTMVVVDRAGKVDNVHIGAKADLEQTLRKELDNLITGPSHAKPLPPEDEVAAKPDKPQPKKRRRPALDLIGHEAPTFTISTVRGSTVSSDTLGKYKATVLNFVAPNCGFCKRQIPNIEKVRAAYETKGIQFVNVAQKMRKDFTTEEIVRTFSDIGSNIDVAHDKNNVIGQRYKAVSFPTLFVLDRNGKVHDVVVGAKKDIEGTITKDLNALLKGPSNAVPLPPEEQGPPTVKKQMDKPDNMKGRGKDGISIRRVSPDEVPMKIRAKAKGKAEKVKSEE